jgi:hypothetical protein
MTSVYLSLLLLSAATLAFEVALTRVFALAQGHHFAFMAVSLALLGAGASGTFLSLRSPSHQGLRRWVAVSALLFTLTVPASYLAVNALPFDAYRIAWERVQILWLALYYLALTAPFFFSGLAVGAALVTRPTEAPRVYGANLFGSGLGLPLALLALAAVGGPGTVFGVAWLGSLAFLILVWRNPHDSSNDLNRHYLGRIVGGTLFPGPTSASRPTNPCHRRCSTRAAGSPTRSGTLSPAWTSSRARASAPPPASACHIPAAPRRR